MLSIYPYLLWGGCLQLDRHLALRPQHGPNAQLSIYQMCPTSTSILSSADLMLYWTCSIFTVVHACCTLAAISAPLTVGLGQGLSVYPQSLPSRGMIPFHGVPGRLLWPQRPYKLRPQLLVDKSIHLMMILRSSYSKSSPKSTQWSQTHEVNSTKSNAWLNSGAVATLSLCNAGLSLAGTRKGGGASLTWLGGKAWLTGPTDVILLFIPWVVFSICLHIVLCIVSVCLFFLFLWLLNLLCLISCFFLNSIIPNIIVPCLLQNLPARLAIRGLVVMWYTAAECECHDWILIFATIVIIMIINVVCLLNSSAIDWQIRTNGRHYRVCYEAADRPSNYTDATRSLFVRCTDVYVTDDVSVLINTSELQRSVAQLCCSVLNLSLVRFNVQPATQLELRISLRHTMVSTANLPVPCLWPTVD